MLGNTLGAGHRDRVKNGKKVAGKVKILKHVDRGRT
jgi:hypothetical protein